MALIKHRWEMLGEGVRGGALIKHRWVMSEMKYYFYMYRNKC